MTWDDLAGLGREAKRASPDALVGSQDDLAKESDLGTLAALYIGNASTPADQVRMAKILQLRSEIIAGTYHVPLEQLAERMLDRAWGQRQATKDMYSV